MEPLCWARPIPPYQYVLQLVNRKAGGLRIESALLAGEKVWYTRGLFAKENLLRNEAGTPDMEVLRQTGKGTDWKTELHVHLNEVRRCRWVSASRDSRRDILDIPWKRIWNMSYLLLMSSGSWQTDFRRITATSWPWLRIGTMGVQLSWV